MVIIPEANTMIITIIAAINIQDKTCK